MEEEIDKMLEDSEILEDKIIAEVPPTEPSVPTIDSKEWVDYVIDQFYENELEGGKPTCDGLRRITEKLIGRIITRDVHVVQPPVKADGIATVIVSIEVDVYNTSHPSYGQNIRESSVADCGSYNTPLPFCAHQSAVAETRAEARALRKILRLRKILAAEEEGEISQEFITSFKPSDPIDDGQIEVLDRIAMRANVSVLHYINSGEYTYKSISEVPSVRAAKMIQHLNLVAHGGAKLPMPLPTYDKSWRKENASAS